MAVSWAAPRTGTDEVEGYKIMATRLDPQVNETKEYRINEASETKKESTVLEDLQPGAKYEVKVREKNTQ